MRELHEYGFLAKEARKEGRKVEDWQSIYCAGKRKERRYSKDDRKRWLVKGSQRLAKLNSERQTSKLKLSTCDG